MGIHSRDVGLQLGLLKIWLESDFGGGVENLKDRSNFYLNSKYLHANDP